MLKMNKILFLILMIYATIFNPFDDDRKNLLVIFFIPILLVIAMIIDKISLKNLFVKKYLTAWIFLLYLLLSAIFNFHRLRWSSLAYSLDFIVCFIVYLYLLEKHVDSKIYSKWLISIISIFFVALVIQQMGVLLGYSDFFNKLNSSSYDIKANYIFSLNSLSSEPSYAITIISVSLFSLLKIKNLDYNEGYTFKNFKRDILIWFMYFYQLIFYRSVFGILFFLIICFYLFDFKKIKTWILLISSCLFLVSMSADYVALNRLQVVFKTFDIRDIAELAQIDHSGSIRVLPLYYYIINFDLYNIHSYLGFGLDYSQTYLRTLIPGIPDDAAFGGLIPSFPFDFGVMGFLILWRVISKFSLTRMVSIETFMILLVMLNATLNTQLFWFVVIIFSINTIIFSSRKAEIFLGGRRSTESSTDTK